MATCVAYITRTSRRPGLTGGCAAVTSRTNRLSSRARHAPPPRAPRRGRSSRAASARARRCGPRCAAPARSRGTSSAARVRRRTPRAAGGPPSFMRSHLFAATMRPRPALSASPAIAASWSVAPSTASSTSTTTSARSIARFDCSTLTRSTAPDRATLPGRRMPAVSTIRNRRFRHCSTVSIASRVVPGMSLTRTRSSRSSRFTSDDLPTLGRPTIATAVSSGALVARASARSPALARPRRRPRPQARSPAPRASRAWR